MNGYSFFDNIPKESIDRVELVSNATKLRLLVTSKCNLDCVKCCNKQYNLDELFTFSFPPTDFEEILITGGEPTLRKDLTKVLFALKRDYKCPIYMYTNGNNPLLTCKLLENDLLDGITLTIHNTFGFDSLMVIDTFNYYMLTNYGVKKSLRLNTFKEDNYKLKSHWVTKVISWEDNCPIPSGEIFMKL